jgi:hypothetical protein
MQATLHQRPALCPLPGWREYCHPATDAAVMVDVRLALAGLGCKAREINAKVKQVEDCGTAFESAGDAIAFLFR